MDRISISLPPPQMTWLKQEAKRLGVTIGELLRRVIDQKVEHAMALRRTSPQPAKEQRR